MLKVVEVGVPKAISKNLILSLLLAVTKICKTYR